MTFLTWISYFTYRIRQPCQLFARPSDLFGTGEAEIFHIGHDVIHIGCAVKSCHIRHRIEGREAIQTAFLAWWLCYFFIPSQPIGIIRLDTFVMASRLAQGNLVSYFDKLF